MTLLSQVSLHSLLSHQSASLAFKLLPRLFLVQMRRKPISMTEGNLKTTCCWLHSPSSAGPIYESIKSLGSTLWVANATLKGHHIPCIINTDAVAQRRHQDCDK